MSKRRFAKHECPLARALDEIGDWWTLLVVRECMYGTSRFQSFRRHLGISRTVLSDRLQRLTASGIVTKSRALPDGRAVEYRLTQKGLDLWPLLIAILVWSNRHVVAGDVVSPRSARSGRVIDRLCAMDASGRLIAPRDLVLRHGKDSSRAFRKRIAAIAGRWQQA